MQGYYHGIMKQATAYRSQWSTCTRVAGGYIRDTWRQSVTVHRKATHSVSLDLYSPGCNT